MPDSIFNDTRGPGGCFFPSRSTATFLSRRGPLVLLLAGFLGGMFPAAATDIGATDAPQYNRDIRPILAENCFSCHGPDSASRKAGLRLDRFAEATAPDKDGKHPIAPENPAASEVIRRICATGADADDVMPPAKTKKTLTPAQRELLKRWIAAGAKYELHWSLIAPKRPPVPGVRNRRWARNPIDSFVLARLEKDGLAPSPEADRRTLARRVTLDLTGLPPAPAEVEAFVNDRSPNAYEKVVDRLLASPRYGEHRARYWLDAARFADSNGIHFDNYREMWAFRDWVIDAFNRNESFDQFTIDQLAGDLIPNHTLAQQVASGFNRCNITSNEGGAIDEEYFVLYARDRTETTAQTWLGLTAGCAVCHDHKFDPISQKEFYSLTAFFNNTTQNAMDGNVQDTPPVIVVARPEDRPRWDAIPGLIKTARERVEHRENSGEPDFTTWLGGAKAESFASRLPADAPLFHALLDDFHAGGLSLNIAGKDRELPLATNAMFQEGVVAMKAYTTANATAPVIPEVGDLEKDQSFSYGAWVYLAKDRDGAIFARMDDGNDFRGWDLWIEGGKPGAHIINHWPDNALKVVSKREIQKDRWTHVFVTYDGSAKAAGVKIYLDGEAQETGVQADKLMGSIRTTVPFKIGKRHSTSPVEGAGLQDLRIYNRVLTAAEVKSLAADSRLAYLLAGDPGKRTDKQRKELYRYWLDKIDSEYGSATTTAAALEKEKMEIKERGTTAEVMQERTNEAAAYVLFRGDYDKRRDKVVPGTPAALPPMTADFPRNRLGFARWLLLPQNPLTARVTMNRFWQQLFGEGIVKTTGDFGVTGELPSHPELLDWMAVEFRESGWDMKRFFKTLVMSATYRQSAVMTPEMLAHDPENRLLARGPRFRMDAEMVRDYALAASGLLAAKIGGPSVKPYQPDGVWEAVAISGSNTGNYKQDSGESLYRRSLYTFRKRSAPPASLDIFNAPNHETCTVRRDRTDTPLQALVTMDDVQFVEAARNLAQHALTEGGSREPERLNFMAERLLGRSLRPPERKVIDGVLRDLLARYQAAPKDADALVAEGESKADGKLDHPTLAAYTMVASEIMNLDEVLNK